MRGLNAQELHLLETSLPGLEWLDLTNEEADICDVLAERGLMRTWRDLDEEGIDSDFWETTATGAMMVSIYRTFGF